MPLSDNQNLTRKRFITSDRAMYIAPVSSGLLVSLLFMIFLLRPLLIESKEANNQLIKDKDKAAKVELLESQYLIVKVNIKNAMEQKKDLIQLVAGPTELQTILSRLQRLTDQNNLQIISILPKEKEFNVPSNNNFGSALTLPGIDPLLKGGIQKYPYEIELEGYFPDLLKFLRDLEELEVIALNSDINIDISYNENETREYKKIKISFILSAYGQ